MIKLYWKVVIAGKSHDEDQKFMLIGHDPAFFKAWGGCLQRVVDVNQ